MSDGPDPDEPPSDRQRMVSDVAGHFVETATQTGELELDDAVRRALLAVPRHRFVPPELRDRAYDDAALPIGNGQTISQPFIVALMTQLARLGPDSHCLEIGTGCGYQAAVLSELAGRVYTIERVPELARGASERLASLGERDVAIRVGDGHLGWPEEAPFDAILVTAAADELPRTLADQLAPGGRLIVPLRVRAGLQELSVVTRGADGELSVRSVLPVAFVPFVRDGTDPPETSAA